MARRSNSHGRAPDLSTLNNLWRKLIEAADKALDGEVDPETGVISPPKAATMEMVRKIISDANLTPSHDVAENASRVYERLPFTTTEDA
jgi:hypothetical protein